MTVRFARKGEARKALEKINMAERKLELFKKAFSQIPRGTVFVMEEFSELITSPFDPDYDIDPSPISPKYELRSYESLIEAIELDLKNQRAMIENIIDKFWLGSKTRGQAVPEKIIAMEIAKIYVKLQAILPTFGTSETKGKERRPSTLYTEVVCQAFKYFSVTGDVKIPCQEAIASIAADNLHDY